MLSVCYGRSRVSAQRGSACLTNCLQVAAGAAALYVQQLQRIERFSPLGRQQLAADLEYFCNVLAALSVALPPELITWAQSQEARIPLLDNLVLNYIRLITGITARTLIGGRSSIRKVQS